VDIRLCSRALLELIDGVEGHHLFTDNYYTGPEFLNWGNNCCGTVHTMRSGFPQELIRPKQEQQDRGTMDTLAMDHCLQLLGMTGDMSIFSQLCTWLKHQEQLCVDEILMALQLMFLAHLCCLTISST